GAQTLGITQLTAISGISVAETGATAGETFTVTVSDTNGHLTATASGGGDTVTGAGTTSLTIAGTLSQVNTDLGTLKDTDSTAGADTITVNASDSFGNVATAKTIAVTANGAPVITVPGAQTVSVGAATAIAGVGVSESGNSRGETFTVTLSDTNGHLSATGTGVSGSGTTSLTIAGTLSQVTADLGTLSDTDSTAGPDTITLNATDSFGNKASQQTIAVTASVTPVITVPGVQTLGITQLTAISGISVAETGATAGETFTVTVSDTNGHLTATASGGGDTVTGAGTTSLTIAGTLSQVNTDLGTLKDTDSTAGADTITVNASDSFGNVATAKTIAVTANGAPVITVPGAQTVSVGAATAIAGVGVSESGNTSGETFTVTLSDTNGHLSATGTGVSGSGTTSLTIAGTLSQVTADLGTLSDTDSTAGPDTITLNATDSFGNKASQQTIAVTASVTPVITVPGAQTLGITQLTAISGISVAETGATAGETFTVTVSDTNGHLTATASGGGDTVTGAGTTSLTIAGTLSQVNTDLGTLKDTDSTAGADTITVNASDGVGNVATAKTIAVTANGAPVITVPGAQTVSVGAATAIAGVGVSESGNTSGETFTVTLSDSAGVLTATGGAQSNSGHTLTFTGLSLTALNTDLGTLSDTDSTAGPDTLTVNASDSFGNVATAKTIAVTAE